jgi:hypothetical protein
MSDFKPDFNFDWENLGTKILPIAQFGIRARLAAGETLETIGREFQGTLLDGADLKAFLEADTPEKLKQWYLDNAT